MIFLNEEIVSFSTLHGIRFLATLFAKMNVVFCMRLPHPVYEVEFDLRLKFLYFLIGVVLLWGVFIFNYFIFKCDLHSIANDFFKVM